MNHVTSGAPDETSRARFSVGPPQFLLLLGGVAAAWIVISGVHELSGIIGPIFLTLNLYIVVYPMQHLLNRLGLPRIIGAVASGLLVIAILLAFLGYLAWATAMFVQEIPQYQGSFITLYAQLIEWLKQLGVSETQLLEQAQRTFSPSNIVSVVQSALSSLTGVLSMLLVTVTVVFVTIIDSMSIEPRAQVLATSKPTVANALVNFVQGVRRYWLVSSFFGLICAVLDVAVLMYLGVPLPLVWGLLSFITNYIPNIGFVLGIVPPAIMALIANDPMTALLVVVAYSVINFVVQSIIQPKFAGESIGVTAGVSLLSLLFWSWALGPLGAILGLPATLLVKSLLIDIDPSLRWLNVFLSNDPKQGESRDEVFTTYGHDVTPVVGSGLGERTAKAAGESADASVVEIPDETLDEPPPSEATSSATGVTRRRSSRASASRAPNGGAHTPWSVRRRRKS
ncbi:MAG: AI-2E family transporter [Dermatophilus congolensis]|nr:AI-2E family transporter [Dermatophilus congolensis]